MDTLYRKILNKKGRARYIPAGVTGVDTYQGLWLVQEMPNGKESRNLALRLCDLPQPIDLTKLVSIELLRKTIQDCMLKASREGSSIYDCTNGIVTALYKIKSDES